MRLFDSADLAHTLRPWLLEHVCRFWLARIHDPAGGFFEGLDAEGAPVRDSKRTTLAQARLVYTFSHAFHLSGEAAFKAAAEHGLAFLTRALRTPDGFVRSTAVTGDAIDATRDAYDHAFVLFALAWYHAAARDPHALRLVDETWRFMETRLADPRHGGFHEEYAPGRSDVKLPRRQNPHMHLLEATLALHAATGDRVWLTRSAALVELFKRRFVDAATGALIEFFDADWTPASGAAGALREPGHQFEWVWLLYEYYRHSRDESIVPFAERLFAFGSRFGIDPEGHLKDVVFDGVDAAGKLVADTKLLWPQTEYIKACVARAEWCDDAGARQRMIAHLGLIGRHFMRADGANWHNQLARDGTPLSPVTPARVLYHLFLAVAEADRLLSSRA
jgi:mannose/cellobiose epimerase-like protein (N-acyl-D-glucosamine 2-epimerase family)